MIRYMFFFSRRWWWCADVVPAGNGLGLITFLRNSDDARRACEPYWRMPSVYRAFLLSGGLGFERAEEFVADGGRVVAMGIGEFDRQGVDRILSVIVSNMSDGYLADVLEGHC